MEKIKTPEAVRAIIAYAHPDKQKSVLLAQRPDWSKQEANKWALLGGKVENTDKNAREALSRELQTEIGFDPDQENLEYEGEYFNSETGWLTIVFVVLLTEQRSFEDQSGELRDVSWFTEHAAMQQNLAFDHGKMLENFFTNQS